MWIKLNLGHIVHLDGITCKTWACPIPAYHRLWLIFRENFVALKKMEPDFWIELESTYRERIAQRKALYAAHGSKVMAAKPDTELASRSVGSLQLT
jgi:hypothetical protein